jgi:hypothetical protein
MNPVTVRYPANKIWDELGVPYRKISDHCMRHGDLMRVQN